MLLNILAIGKQVRIKYPYNSIKLVIYNSRLDDSLNFLHFIGLKRWNRLLIASSISESE